jgi:hypothetical protein
MQCLSVITQWLSAFGFALTGNMTAILLASGALLAMISLRNGHLSERARDNVTECRYELYRFEREIQNELEKDLEDRLEFEEVAEQLRVRRASLEQQIDKFVHRYKSTSSAFIFLAIALACFAVTGTLSRRDVLDGQFQPAVQPELGGALGLVGSLFSLFSLYIMCREFLIGPETLRDNSKTAGFSPPKRKLKATAARS